MNPGPVVAILFVCSGNTCRSPMAAAVMQSLVRRAGLGDVVEIASAGIAVHAVGAPASLPALAAAARRGHDLSGHRTRALAAADLARATHPRAMAAPHLAAMRALAPPGLAGRPRLLLARDVDDPWGGTAQDYERALDLIEAGCDELLEQILRLPGLAGAGGRVGRAPP